MTTYNKAGRDKVRGAEQSGLEEVRCGCVSSNSSTQETESSR